MHRVAAPADAEHPAKAVDRETLPHPIDELEPHQSSSRTNKAVARFNMSRSCRTIPFSHRRSVNLANISSCAGDRAYLPDDQVTSDQHASVDKPTDKSFDVSAYAPPLVAIGHTASCYSSFANHRYFGIDLACHLKGALHFSVPIPERRSSRRANHSLTHRAGIAVACQRSDFEGEAGCRILKGNSATTLVKWSGSGLMMMRTMF